jgi:hypothetical protein
LAFGVGMKLSQRAAAAKSQPARADLSPALERIAEIEKRLTESERAPVAQTFDANGTPFDDQKVLEAVIAALDARLHEQTGRTESRITELEARLAIGLKSLAQHDQTVSSGVATHLDNLRSELLGQIAELQRAAQEEREAVRGEFIAVHREFAEEVARAVEKRVEDAMGLQAGEFHTELLRRDDQIHELRRDAQTERQAVRSEMVSMNRDFAEEVARAVERQVEEAVGRQGVRFQAELAHKDDQIAELREVLVGFAQACRALVERPALREKTGAEPEPSNVQALPGRRAG